MSADEWKVVGSYGGSFVELHLDDEVYRVTGMRDTSDLDNTALRLANSIAALLNDKHRRVERYMTDSQASLYPGGKVHAMPPEPTQRYLTAERILVALIRSNSGYADLPQLAVTLADQLNEMLIKL